MRREGDRSCSQPLNDLGWFRKKAKEGWVAKGRTFQPRRDKTRRETSEANERREGVSKKHTSPIDKNYISKHSHTASHPITCQDAIKSYVRQRDILLRPAHNSLPATQVQLGLGDPPPHICFAERERERESINRAFGCFQFWSFWSQREAALLSCS